MMKHSPAGSVPQRSQQTPLYIICLSGGCLKTCFLGAVMDLQTPGMVALLMRWWQIKRNSPLSCESQSELHPGDAASQLCEKFILNLARDRQLNLKCDYEASFYLVARKD
ncbi:hypothetical protein ABVT39_001060 [Epinephelus coioides]